LGFQTLKHVRVCFKGVTFVVVGLQTQERVACPRSQVNVHPAFAMAKRRGTFAIQDVDHVVIVLHVIGKGDLVAPEAVLDDSVRE
jgi:hypothetical protein